MDAIIRGLRLLRRFGRKAGPYLMLEILMPGGTLLALLLYCTCASRSNDPKERLGRPESTAKADHRRHGRGAARQGGTMWTMQNRLHCRAGKDDRNNDSWPGAASCHRVKRRYRVPLARVRAWLDGDREAGCCDSAARWACRNRYARQGAFCFVQRQGGASDTLEITRSSRQASPSRSRWAPSCRYAGDRRHRSHQERVRSQRTNTYHDQASQLEGRWTGILYGLGETLDPASTPFTTSGSES
jgi:hypothetical protein